MHRTGIGRGAGRRRLGKTDEESPRACALVQRLEARMMLSGTWTLLSQTAPGGLGTMLLLPDGSVIASLNGASTDWARLTPNAAGSYINGTWTRLASMHDSRLYDASQVLQDGRLFVAGGEYGSGSKTGEVYDPLTNTWTLLPAQSFGAFSDSGSEMLPNGNVLIAPVAPNPGGFTVIFHPANNSWSLGPKLVRGNSADEQSWVKLTDGSILSVDGASSSERYIPSLNQWVNDGTLPVNLFDTHGELGAGFLLPDGRAFFIGATSRTALYTPSGTNAPGTWSAGPTIPNGLGAPDAPSAMLPDGTVLLALGPSNTFNGPTSFYLYDPVSNSLSPVTNAPNVGGAPFGARMLDLPDGTVLYTTGGNRPYVYNPGTTGLAAGQPTLTSITPNGNGTFHLTGTLFNGISEGAAYGDDAQMNSNYPITRFTSGTGAVFYGRTFNWSSTGVATGTATETADVVLPLGLAPGDYSVAVIANGNASQPMTLTIPTPADDAAPTVATPAAASSPVTGTTTPLSVLGDDAEGEANLTYTWTALSVPGGSPLPSYSINGSNAAKNTTVTFYRAGNYTFNVFITDSAGLSVTSSVSLVVTQTETSVAVSPDKFTLTSGTSKQFTAQALDQFAQPMAVQPRFSWTTTGGAISLGGLLIAPSAGMLVTVTASDGTFQGSAAVGVVSAPWASQDIGGVGITGLAYNTGNNFVVSGSGSDIWGTSDQFRFVYRLMAGNGSITARVVSEQNTDPFAKIGVMIRNTLDPTDAFAFMDVTPANGTAFQFRATKGGQAVNSNVGNFVAPYWVRLVRNGNTFLGYRSPNGSAWSLQFQTTIAMNSTVYVGLDVCSHNNNLLNTAVLDHVAMSQPGVALAASADPNPVTTGTTNLSVLGTDPGGESLLNYTWSATVVPQGVAAPTFSINGTNAAKNTLATFSAPGDYTFVVTISDGTGLVATSSVDVSVVAVQAATVTSVAVGWGASGTAPLQTAPDGLRLLPSGRNTDLPFAGINQIFLTLSQAETLLPGDVSITGLTIANYGPVTLSGSGANYTITLAQPITGPERLTLTIGNAGITTFTRELDVLPGDLSDDGMVGFADLLTLAQNYGASNADWTSGDLNGDGSVNFNDLLTLAQNYGGTIPVSTALVRKTAAGSLRARVHT